MSSQFNLILSTPVGRRYREYLSQHLRKSHAILAPALRELSIALVTDATISDLHQRFMGISGPTDVLTFELDEGDRGAIIAGEVVVCLDEAKRAAKSGGIPVEHELLLYAIHGMLHL